jgi:hypothetical protein
MMSIDVCQEVHTCMFIQGLWLFSVEYAFYECLFSYRSGIVCREVLPS